MIFNGIILYALTEEFKDILLGGYIHNIYHIPEYTLKFIISKNKKTYIFFISIDPDFGCCTITSLKEKNPPAPSNFCSFLRTHLINSFIAKIEQVCFDRVLYIYLENHNEKNFNKLIVLEFMGKYSNFILVNQANNRILESMRHVDKEMSSKRKIYPGQIYTQSPKQEKLSPFLVTEENFLSIITSGKENGYKTLTDNFSGISGNIAKYIYNEDNNKSWQNFSDLFSALKEKKFSPEIIIEKKTNKIIHLNPVKISGFDSDLFEKIQFSSICSCVDYYLSLTRKNYLDYLKFNLINNIKKIVSKLIKREKNLKNSVLNEEEIKKYELYGKLLTANIYKIAKGISEISLQNIFNDKAEKINISLDPSKNPAQNAQEYFKKYHKNQDAYKALKNKLEMTEDEIFYLEEKINEIKKSDTDEQLNEVKNILVDQNYLHIKTKIKKKLLKNKNMLPKCFISSDGYEILVGNNDKENDYVTMRLARLNDLWLHVKQYTGAHVIVRNKTQCDIIPVKTIEEAALLAAYFSRSRDSSNIPVDYTYRKFIRKPKGRTAGLVLYKNEKTLFVTPKKELIDELKINKLQNGYKRNN